MEHREKTALFINNNSVIKEMQNKGPPRSARSSFCTEYNSIPALETHTRWRNLAREKGVEGQLTCAVTHEVCERVLHGEGTSDRQDHAAGGVIDGNRIPRHMKKLAAVRQVIHLDEIPVVNAAVPEPR